MRDEDSRVCLLAEKGRKTQTKIHSLHTYMENLGVDVETLDKEWNGPSIRSRIAPRFFSYDP
jgi:hypothetical protein